MDARARFELALTGPEPAVLPLDDHAMAEEEGFEPPRPFGLLVFKTSAINRTLPLLYKWRKL